MNFEFYTHVHHLVKKGTIIMKWTTVETPRGLGTVIGRFADGCLLVAVRQAPVSKLYSGVAHIKFGWCELHQAAYEADGKCDKCKEAGHG